MYIGPWQEYKLAQIIKLNNNLYQSSPTLKLSQTKSTLSISENSNTTSRSSKAQALEALNYHPSINIDSYYSKWSKIESILSKPDLIPKRPSLPKLKLKTPGQTLQSARINQMRLLYGLTPPNLSKLPPLSPDPIIPNQMAEISEQEESLNVECVDGLLKWVESLPDEVPNHDLNKKSIIL